VRLATALLKTAPDVRILLVGDGMEKPLVEEQARLAGVLDVNLFIEGPVSKREMPAIFAASDMICSLFVDMKEMQANSANKFFDTLAAGKPILINYGGWQADIVNRESCGIVTWRKSFEDAASWIASHLSDENFMEKAGKASKRIAVEFFDRDRLAAQLAEVLTVAADRKGDKAQSIASGKY